LTGLTSQSSRYFDNDIGRIPLHSILVQKKSKQFLTFAPVQQPNRLHEF